MAKRKPNDEEYIRQRFDIEVLEDGTTSLSPSTVLTGSNALWKAKAKTNLFLQKLSDLCLANARVMPDGSLKAAVPASEIRKFTGVTGNGLYAQLKEATEEQMSRYLLLEDEEEKKFLYVNLIKNAGYQNGQYCVEYNEFLKPHLFGLTDHYTTIKLDVLGKWGSVYTYKLFVLLSTTKYLLNYNKVVKVNFPLGELRAELGSLDPKQKDVQRMIKSGMSWNEIAEKKNDEVTYPTWGGFSQYVLKKAVKEINESHLSEFMIRNFEPIKEGSRHKVVSVNFYLERNPKYSGYRPGMDVMGEEIKQEYLDGIKIQFVSTVRQIFEGAPITDREALALLKEANNDLRKIEQAYAYARKQKEVSNLVGYVRTAIKNGCWGDGKNIPSMEGHTLEEAQAVSEVKDAAREFIEHMDELYEMHLDGVLNEEMLDERERRALARKIDVAKKMGTYPDSRIYRRPEVEIVQDSEYVEGESSEDFQVDGQISLFDDEFMENFPITDEEEQEPAGAAVKEKKANVDRGLSEQTVALMLELLRKNPELSNEELTKMILNGEM